MPKYLVYLDTYISTEVKAPDEETALLRVEHEILAQCSDCIEVELLEEDEEDG